MKDWKTPLDEANASLLEARDALDRADLSGMEKALCDVPTLLDELLNDVIAAQCESNES